MTAAPLPRQLCQNAAEWQNALTAMPVMSLQQSWAYGELMLALGRQVERFIWRSDTGEVMSAAQIITRRIGPVHLVSALRAPVFSAGCYNAQKARVLREISKLYQRRKLKFLFLMPELLDDESNRALIKITGRRRIVTGHPTALWDIRDDTENLLAKMKDNWRQALRKAEHSRLQIKISRGGPLLHWLLEREQQQIADKGYQTIPPALINLLIEKYMHPQDVWVMTALDGKDPVAGQLWLRHGNAATYYIGVTTPAGREAAAHNLLLWRAAQELKAAGVTMLDLGGADNANPGLANFKLKTGAVPYLMLGSYH